MIPRIEIVRIKLAISKAFNVTPLEELIEELEKSLSDLKLIRDNEKILEDFIRKSENE